MTYSVPNARIIHTGSLCLRTEPRNQEPSIDSSRLFIGSCIALIATSVAFATVGAIMLSLKREFVLTNEEVGWIGGAALWGFRRIATLVCSIR